jgi:hypothetical protein
MRAQDQGEREEVRGTPKDGQAHTRMPKAGPRECKKTAKAYQMDPMRDPRGSPKVRGTPKHGQAQTRMPKPVPRERKGVTKAFQMEPMRNPRDALGRNPPQKAPKKDTKRRPECVVVGQERNLDF